MSDYTIAAFEARWREVEASSTILRGLSLADRLAVIEGREPGFTGELLDSIGPLGCQMLAYDSAFWLRPKQLAVTRSTAYITLSIQGRGGGKTRTASEWLVDRLERGAREIVIVGPTDDDVTQFMLGGHKRRDQGGNGSGLLDVMPPWIRYQYRKDDAVIEFPDLHAVCYLHSSHVPEYRGPNPDSVWGDEIIKWRYPERLLSNLELACRSVGKIEPQILLTTSPKRRKFLRDLVMRDDVHVVTGDTRENRGHVHSGWLDGQERRLRGTRQGDEELGGKLGVDDGSELFPLGTIDANRVDSLDEDLERIAVSIDPGFSSTRHADETGIVGGGRSGSVADGHVYILDDKTGRYTPEKWGDAAFDMLEEIGASAFIVEKNHIGEQAAANLRAAGWRRGWRPVDRRKANKTIGTDLEQNGRRIQIVEVVSRDDKATRAAPVSTMYQSRRVHHVGTHERLEAEMSEWDPETRKSPNGLDALVHLVTELCGLHDSARPDAREAFRGMAEANRRARDAAGVAEVREPTIVETREASSGGLAAALASARRGHWGSRL